LLHTVFSQAVGATALGSYLCCVRLSQPASQPAYCKRERDLSGAKDSRVDISSEQLALCKLIFQLLTAATVRFFVIPPMYVLYIQL
jgi:hypothetical protein